MPEVTVLRTGDAGINRVPAFRSRESADRGRADFLLSTGTKGHRVTEDVDGYVRFEPLRESDGGVVFVAKRFTADITTCDECGTQIRSGRRFCCDEHEIDYNDRIRVETRPPVERQDYCCRRSPVYFADWFKN